MLLLDGLSQMVLIALICVTSLFIQNSKGLGLEKNLSRSWLKNPKDIEKSSFMLFLAGSRFMQDLDSEG